MLLIILLSLFQNNMIYVNKGPFPTYPEGNPPGYRSPSDLELKYKDVTIHTKDN